MFLPVGHGAFYCERFFPSGTDEPINVVYDCGAIPEWPVEREITSLFDQGNTIHAVFISHFHEDHVNGLPALMKRCRVKRIYYPYLDAKAKSLMEIWLKANGEDKSDAFRFLQNPNGFVNKWSRMKGGTALIAVLPNLGTEESPPSLGEGLDRRMPSAPIAVTDLLKEGKKKEASLGALVDWMYLPFNFRQDALIEQLETAFEAKGWSLDRLANMPMSPEIREEIRSVYNQVVPDCNLTSMVLFSGIDNSEVCQRGNAWEGGLRSDWKTSAGCLYTGDYKAKGNDRWKALDEVYSPFKEYVGCVQIPHHGSESNFNDDFCGNNIILVASAGLGNRYHLPSQSVVRRCEKMGCGLQVVSEERRSRVDTLVCAQSMEEELAVAYFCQGIDWARRLVADKKGLWKRGLSWRDIVKNLPRFYGNFLKVATALGNYCESVGKALAKYYGGETR